MNVITMIAVAFKESETITLSVLGAALSVLIIANIIAYVLYKRDVRVGCDAIDDSLNEENLPEHVSTTGLIATGAHNEEDDAINTFRYDRSFRARLIQPEDRLKFWYGDLKNEILSYDGVTDRISWKHETFHLHRATVATLVIKGKTLCVYLPLNVADYAGTKYHLEDVSDVARYAYTPALYRIKSERRLKYAFELINKICADLGSNKTDRGPVDYYEPYLDNMALLNKGLIKRIV